MKTSGIRFLLVFIAGTLFSCGPKKAEKTAEEKLNDALKINKPSNATLEDLSASMVIAVNKNNFDIIEKYLPLKEDVDEILQVYDGSENEKKQILAGAEENVKAIRANTRQAFDDILSKGTKAGIAWGEAILDNADYTLKRENNIEMADLKIIFSYKNLRYKISIAECIKTKKGWLIFDKPKWQG